MAASQAAASARAVRSVRSSRAGRVHRRSGHSCRRQASPRFQRASPATASNRCRKREATVGAPPTFAAWVRITSPMSEQLREVVRGEADAALRQIEAEFVPHRPAQPRIDPRRRRPHALDESAEDDAIGFRQPRFELAVDLQMRIGVLRPPHHAVGERGLEHFGDSRRAEPPARSASVRRAVRRRRRQAPIPGCPRTPRRRRPGRMKARSSPRSGAAPVRRNHTASTSPCSPAAQTLSAVR